MFSSKFVYLDLPELSPTQVCSESAVAPKSLQRLTVLSLVRYMSGTAFGTGLILFYFLFYFCLLLLSNFRGSKNRGSMDPVHILMDPVHGGGPWTRGPCFVLSLNFLPLLCF